MRRALTLVEVIVALGLLSAILIFVLNLFPTALATMRKVENGHQLEHRARLLLEMYSTENWTVGTRRNPPAFQVDRFRVRPEVEVAPYQTYPRLVLWRCTLRWNDGRGEKSLVRETLVNRLER